MGDAAVKTKTASRATTPVATDVAPYQLRTRTIARRHVHYVEIDRIAREDWFWLPAQQTVRLSRLLSVDDVARTLDRASARLRRREAVLHAAVGALRTAGAATTIRADGSTRELCVEDGDVPGGYVVRSQDRRIAGSLRDAVANSRGLEHAALVGAVDAALASWKVARSRCETIAAALQVSVHLRARNVGAAVIARCSSGGVERRWLVEGSKIKRIEAPVFLELSPREEG